MTGDGLYLASTACGGVGSDLGSGLLALEPGPKLGSSLTVSLLVVGDQG